MRLAVFGAKGLLGSAIVHAFSAQHDVTAFDRAAVDITDPAAVAAAVQQAAPAVMINCAGYNGVDAAEDHPVDALKANAFAVRNLARAARAHDATLVHYSSDFVFDGTRDQPHTEADPPNPRSVYATSKMLGEWFAADAPRAYIVRVESLFGAGGAGRGSVAGIIKGLREGTLPRVFEDRTVSPTYVPDLVRATAALIGQKVPAGLYHCVNSGHCTWVEFAREAARLLGVEPKFHAVRMAEVTLRAPRPLYCALSNAKLAAAGIAMPTWQDALARYIDTRD